MRDPKEAARLRTKQDQIRVFPIRIVRRMGGVDKKPLVAAWQHQAHTDVERFDWGNANGYGMLMGNGYYALDLDTYKAGARPDIWLRQWHLPKTRAHKTTSGGTHLLFRLPYEWRDLRTRSSVVPGLDGRGKGGFIAFGEGYSVTNDCPMATLPVTLCRRLHMNSRTGDRVEPEYIPPNGEGLAAKLKRALHDPTDAQLAARWQVPDWDSDEMADTTRSALDMSVAGLLARRGFDYHEIISVLRIYPHGAISRMSANYAMRSAKRCASMVGGR